MSIPFTCMLVWSAPQLPLFLRFYDIVTINFQRRIARNLWFYGHHFCPGQKPPTASGFLAGDRYICYANGLLWAYLYKLRKWPHMPHTFTSKLVCALLKSLFLRFYAIISAKSGEKLKNKETGLLAVKVSLFYSFEKQRDRAKLCFARYSALIYDIIKKIIIGKTGNFKII